VSRLARRNRKQIQALNRSLITLTSPKSPISEQYRTIRTNIQFSTVDRQIRSILVTSAGPAEGKSTTSANLAVVFAQQGKKVLFIDADLRRSTMHYTFRLDNHVGLTNVLTKQVSLERAVQSTEQENLDVLTSGPIPPNPAELLGSRSMEELLEQAFTQYDLVLFDTPPVLAVTDAQILANLCDGIVLVVSSGKTEIEAAQKAKEALANAKGKLLGVVLNNKKMKESQYYYYYARK
jgi:protein-tyrosine kinase